MRAQLARTRSMLPPLKTAFVPRSSFPSMKMPVAAVALLLPLATLAAESPRHAAMTAFETVELAKGIYGFIPPENTSALVSGNSVAIVGTESVLVVDAGHWPSATRRIIDELRKRTLLPVLYLLNTHWHPDHVTGNAEFQAAFPGLVIVSTLGTGVEFERMLPKNEGKALVDSTAGVRKALVAGKHGNGKPITAQERAYYSDYVEGVDAIGDEVLHARHCPPQLNFAQDLTFHLGGRDVQVSFPGRGNTGGDAVAYVPDAKLLVVGDLVVHPLPYAFGSFMFEWPATLRKLMAPPLGGATVIVPGHGPVMRDKAYLERLVRLLDAVATQTRRLAASGLTEEQARKRLDLGHLRDEFTGGDQGRNILFDGGFTDPGFHRAFREAKEGPLHDEE